MFKNSILVIIVKNRCTQVRYFQYIYEDKITFYFEIAKSKGHFCHHDKRIIYEQQLCN